MERTLPLPSEDFHSFFDEKNRNKFAVQLQNQFIRNDAVSDLGFQHSSTQ